jgi:hypothetical protein
MTKKWDIILFIRKITNIILLFVFSLNILGPFIQKITLEYYRDDKRFSRTELKFILNKRNIQKIIIKIMFFFLHRIEFI